MYKELIRTRANKAGGQKHTVKMTDDNYTKLIYWRVYQKTVGKTGYSSQLNMI